MKLFVFVAVVAVVAISTGVEARSYTLVKKGHECNGEEKYVGHYPSVSQCAGICKRGSNMFVYGTNEFGVNRCNKKGCACYCEGSTTAVCKKTIGHRGYNLYALDRKAVRLVGNAKECNGAERNMGYKKTKMACALTCKSSAAMMVYGTNKFGVKRCSSSGCACYCEDATIAKCVKTIEHKGYNLYRFNNPRFGDEKSL